MNRRTYLRAAAATAAASGLAGCSGFRPGGSGGDPGTSGSGGTLGAVDARVETITSDLEVPWGAAFRDNALYLTERPGRLLEVPSVAGGTGGEPEVVADLTDGTEPAGEGGLLGLEFDPRGRNVVYLYQTYSTSKGIRNRVLRGDLADLESTARPIVEGIPASSIHNGGRLAIDGDALYVTAGDASRSGFARDRGSLAGKVLRYTLDGTPHPENPFGSAIYSYGHRNPQGLAFRDGRLYGTEHGPDHDDEINLLEPGGNYGWPDVMGTGGDSGGNGGSGDGSDGGFTAPLATYTPTVAPASAAFYDGPIADWQGDLFFGTLTGAFLGRAQVDGRTVGEQGTLLSGEFGRLRTAFTGPDDHLYVTTSNRDGRGSPAKPDDRVLRIRPR
ncbi:glucose sorbosone dehydrogenase [Halobacteriales archaeon QS_8_65_32]|nr:MAG: glucose sorbosone dehydrogenase [Halobacteriales archaeon QS_8_65_32]